MLRFQQLNEFGKYELKSLEGDEGAQSLRHLSLHRTLGLRMTAAKMFDHKIIRSAAAGVSTTASHRVSEDEVLVEEKFATKIAVLNRPGKLNSLTWNMVTRLNELYSRWEKDPYVRLVIIKGNGRAFCAGGDVALVYHMKNEGKLLEAADFFRGEYVLNYLIGTYRKPHVAFLSGIVMGGGTGISVHGTFRVATETSVFAMPETGIGLHPDVGASYYLPRLPGHLGEYLGLTGTRLDGAEMVACGLATHFVTSHRLGMLEDRLGSLNTENRDVISSAIDDYCDIAHIGDNSPLHRQKAIDTCFGRSSMEEIVRTIEAGVDSGDPWYQETLNKLKKASPLSLKITLRSIREGRRQTLSQCLKREFRLSARAVEAKMCSDFAEGCRAALVEKDNAPKWNPETLQEVTSDLVNFYFSPLGEELGKDLELDVSGREPRTRPSGYARL